MIAGNCPSPGIATPTVSIFGSCASRNPFNVKTGTDYQVKVFVQRMNQMLLDQQPVSDPLTDDDVELLRAYLEKIKSEGMLEVLSHPFNVRMLKNLFNNNCKELLLEKKSEWIVLDTYYLFSDSLYIIKNGHNDIYYLQTDYTFGFLVKTVLETNPKYRRYSMIRTDACLNQSYMINGLAEFLNEKYPQRVIVIDSRPGDYCLSNGSMRRMPTDVNVYEHCSSFLEKLKRLTEYITIRLPDTLVCWDGVSVHYTEEYFVYLKNQIDYIISGKTEEERLSAEEDFSKICHEKRFEYEKICSFDFSRLTAESDRIKEIGLLKKYNERAVNNEPEYYGKMADLLVQNSDEVSLKLAIELEKMAVTNGVKGAKTHIYEILKTIGEKRSFDPMKEYIEEKCEKNDLLAYFMKARMYRDGMGVAKDLKKAAEFMRISADGGYSWARNELLQILWNIGDNCALSDMVNRSRIYAEGGNEYGMFWLAQAYHYGKGVEKDAEQARKLYRQAEERGVLPAKTELSKMDRFRR